MTELGHLGPGHGDLLQEQLSSLLHHLLTAGQILAEQNRGDAETQTQTGSLGQKLPEAAGCYLLLQRGECDEAEEELSS